MSLVSITIFEGSALDGDMNIKPLDSAHTSDVPLHEPTVYHQTGAAADFLTKKGFGWLMDEEAGEDDNKPLL